MVNNILSFVEEADLVSALATYKKPKYQLATPLLKTFRESMESLMDSCGKEEANAYDGDLRKVRDIIFKALKEAKAKGAKHKLVDGLNEVFQLITPDGEAIVEEEILDEDLELDNEIGNLEGDDDNLG